MAHPFLISASILSADFSCLKDQVHQLENAGVDWIHIDVMDGRFVPNLTMGPFVVQAFHHMTRLPLDVHLMIEEPERLLEAFSEAGASGLTVHVETCPNLHRTLQRIRELGCKPGVVINPGTPASAVEPVLHLVDLVLVLSVNPGYSGQVFLPEVLPKVAEIRRSLELRNLHSLIEIDGGITSENLPLAYQAGVRVFVSATSIFHHPQGIGEGVKALRASCSV